MEFKKFFVYPRFPQSLEKLVTISYNLWFTWDFDALSLFYKMDAELFRKVKHNPIKFIHLLPKEKIQALSQDKKFLNDLQEIWERFEEYLKKSSPVVESLGISSEDTIAYFCTEFALHEALPVYAGGLGVLAGDILMGASDFDIPIVGFSLLYNKGYFKQVIDQTKIQREEPEKFDRFLSVLREVKDQAGNPLLLEISILDNVIKAKLWKVEVGKRLCFFLDCDIPENPQEWRNVLDYLYPADAEKRLKQEILLGVGGYVALKKLGLNPRIYHLNEGHSAFVILPRLRELMLERGLSYEEAALYIQETTVFTTHTPLIAGNEHFDTKLVEKYIGPELKALGITLDQFMQCGCILGDKTIFWLPALTIRKSRFVNAVSKLHQETTKKMWHPLFPDWLLEEVPIDYVTNGIHWRWLSEPFEKLLRDYVGPDYRFLSHEDPAWEEILRIPDEEIWEAHRKNKQRLINCLNRFLEEEYLKGDSQKATKRWSVPLKRFHMIVGCARRVTGYKRNHLILFDKERLLRLLQDSERPVLFVFAGKAHPKDIEGKKIIQEILEFREKYQVEDRLIFLDNYDLHLARTILWGSDVWLNLPYRPMEASGTSGMKACMNGVLHLSVLDGWWVEAYDGTNGWAIEPKDGLPPFNFYEANQLYGLLEGEIRELFYKRDEEGIPREWVYRMKRAFYTVCKYYSMNRVLGEYLQRLYLPALAQSRTLAKDDFAMVRALISEKRILEENWRDLKILNFYTNLKSEEIWEDTELEVYVEISLGNLSPDLLTVELVCIRETGLDEENTKKEINYMPMELTKQEGNKATYEVRYSLYGHGLRRLGVRVIPRSEILRRAFTELIKWY
ncbi:MAG: alpha-glucan family phosphorylase [Caldimicrobium sp.]|nr:alpha-glucan family phosphorylase [Caldimicrobium sp.]MDW8183231.1 alpha-glucan family phosphorylase [Caldimicrobium sp.]